MKWSALTVLFLLFGCCEDDLARDRFRLMSDFEMEVRISDSTAVSATSLVPLAAGTEYGLDVRFQNVSSDKMWIDWETAAYFDENGNRHAVVAHEGGGLPSPGELPKGRKPIEPGRTLFYSVAVEDKVRFQRVNCRRSTTVYHPIVPWPEVDMQTGRQMVERLASDKKEVAFVFPVSVGSDVHRIEILLRPVLLAPEARTQTASSE